MNLRKKNILNNKYIFLIFLILVLKTSIFSQNYVPKQVIIRTKVSLSQKTNQKAVFTTQSLKVTDPVLKKYKIKGFVPMPPFRKDKENLRLLSGSEGESKAFDEYHYLILLEEDLDIKNVVNDLKESKNIIHVQPNYKYKLIGFVPNDIFYGAYQWNMRMLNMEDVWLITRGEPDTVIAVIDSGIDWRHEDLKDNIWQNTDETSDINTDADNNGYYGDVRGIDIYGYEQGSYFFPDNDPMDVTGHGSHVAGIAAAMIDNHLGVAGVAPNCSIMPIKVVDRDGASNTYLIRLGIWYAINNSADVINISMGQDLSAGPPSPDLLLDQAIISAQQQNIVVVVAAGNDAVEITQDLTPASTPGVITVSAIDINKNLAGYSNYGSYIDLAAPGGTSTSENNTIIASAYIYNDQYIGMTGTSMAAPHVSGAAALLKSCFADISTSDIYSVLTTTTEHLGGPPKTNAFGHGLVDPYQAILSLETDIPTATYESQPTANMGYQMVITLNVTDDLMSEFWPSVNMYYAYLSTPNATPSNWQSQKMTKDGELFSASLDASQDKVKVCYYFEVADIIPTHNRTFPLVNPQSNYFSRAIDDLTPPQIIFPKIDNDFFAAENSLQVIVTDNVAVSENTIELAITASDTVTYNLTDSGVLQYTNSVLNINTSSLNLPANQAISFLVSASDINGFSTNESVKLQSSSNLKLFGPEGENSPIVNAPNPFDPTTETTKICFQVSLNSEIIIYIYSLNLQLVEKFQLQAFAGYTDEIEWNGRDQKGDPVPNGVYILVIKAKADGQTVIKRNKIAVLRR